MLYQDIKSSMTSSLKDGDKFRVETIRYLISKINNYAIEKYGADFEKKICEEDVLMTIKKQRKSYKESIKIYQKADRIDLLEKEKKELSIISEYLPEELSDRELKSIIKKSINEIGNKNFGAIMKEVMSKVQGRADGAQVAQMVRALSS